jgi:hypothetical protein
VPEKLLANNIAYFNRTNVTIIAMFFSTYTDSVLENRKWIYRLNNNPLTPAAECNCGNPPRCDFPSKACSKNYGNKFPRGIIQMESNTSHIADFFNTVFLVYVVLFISLFITNPI